MEVTVGFPLTVTVSVVVQATSIAVVRGSIENVVAEERVEGATIMLRGAIPVAVLDLGSITASPRYTSPEPSLPPFVFAPDIDLSEGSSLLGFVVEPGPPSSRAQAKRPPIHLLLAKSAFCFKVLELSKETLREVSK